MPRLAAAIVGLLAVTVATSLSVQGQYSHGTAVIALPTGNQMVFAADSAAQYDGTVTNDTCKITKIDAKTIFTQSGVAGIGPNDKSFVNKAAQLVRENPIHTQQDLMSVATVLDPMGYLGTEQFDKEPCQPH